MCHPTRHVVGHILPKAKPEALFTPPFNNLHPKNYLKLLEIFSSIVSPCFLAFRRLSKPCRANVSAHSQAHPDAPSRISAASTSSPTFLHHHTTLWTIIITQIRLRGPSHFLSERPFPPASTPPPRPRLCADGQLQLSHSERGHPHVFVADRFHFRRFFFLPSLPIAPLRPHSSNCDP